MLRRYFPLLFLPFLHSCYNSDLEFTDQFEPVVEAYLYADYPINQVKLSSMISFGSDSTSGEAITKAVVTLARKEESWILLHNDSVPGTYYLAHDPQWNAGEEVELTVKLEETILTALTLIPDNPPAVSMSTNKLSIPKVSNMQDMRGMEWPDPVEISWDNPESRYYFLDIQNIESNPQSIKPDMPDGHPGGGGFAFQMITQPTDDSFQEINPMQLEYFGTHRIIFTSVNDEYAYLYNSLNQDSRELNEPFTNIDGGLGIFTAFNSDTIYLEVSPDYQ